MNNFLTYGIPIPFSIWFILLLENAIRVIGGMIGGIILYKLFNKKNE